MLFRESNHFLNQIFHAAIVRLDAFRHVDQLDQPDVRCHLLGGTGTGCAESPAHSQHLWPAAQDVQNLAFRQAISLTFPASSCEVYIKVLYLHDRCCHVVGSPMQYMPGALEDFGV